MDWKDEVRSEFPFELISGPENPRVNLDILKQLGGRYTVQGESESGDEPRWVDLRVDPEHALISGDVFEDGARQEHHYSFISESIACRKTAFDCFTIVCFVDMFDSKPVKKGGLLLRCKDGHITDCSIMAFESAGGGMLPSRHYSVRAGRMDGPHKLFRQMKLDVFHALGADVPKVFDDPPYDFANTKTVNSVESAFRRAGVAMKVEVHSDPVLRVGTQGPVGEVTNEELHALLAQDPAAETMRWGARLLYATRLTPEPGKSAKKLGVMFDAQEPARQGAAVFLEAIRDSKEWMTDPQAKQNEIEYLNLHTTIHEIGHLFNLLHTHQKDLDPRRTRIGRGGSLSWMAYRRLFPFGRLAQFVGRRNWAGHDLFRRLFRDWENFDRDEILHIRHGPYPDVVMGGAWAVPSAAGDLVEFQEMAEDSQFPDISLDVTLRGAGNGAGAMPSIEQYAIPEGRIRLRYTGTGDIDLPRGVAAEDGVVELWIGEAGSGHARRYKPPQFGCGELELVHADGPEEMEAPLPPMFGAEGWFAHKPATYVMHAVCRLPDGRTLVSNPLKFKVRKLGTPLSKGLAKRLENPRVAQFVALNGSHAPYFECVCETVEKLKKDKPKLAISRQLGALHLSAGVRPWRIRNAGELNADQRYRNAQDLLGLNKGQPAGAKELGNADPARIASALADAYRTVTEYRGGDVTESRDDSPPAAERVKKLTEKLLKRSKASKQLRKWTNNIIDEKTEQAVAAK